MGLVLKNVNITGGKLQVNTPPKWWTRNPNWLPMPEILPTDNKFAGLFAVFEDGFNAVRISAGNTGTTSIDWGDGTTDTQTGAFNYEHTYNYATLGGAVLTHPDGRKYKQVMIVLNMTNTTMTLRLALQTSTATGTASKPQNFLDILFSSTRATFDIRIFDFSTAGSYLPIYVERIRGFANLEVFECGNAIRLKVLDITLLNTATISNRLQNIGDIRQNEQGDLFNLTANFLFGAFTNSFISELGNLNNVTSLFSFANQCRNLQKVGNITFTGSTMANAFDNDTNLSNIGTIDVTLSLTTFSSVFRSCISLKELIFTGNMGGVTTTTSAFDGARNLRRLLLPNITIGFNISQTQITGQNLQDLFTSLGTANGAQTITLPTFTTGESTTIATGKGYTIAYA